MAYTICFRPYTSFRPINKPYLISTLLFNSEYIWSAYLLLHPNMLQCLPAPVRQSQVDASPLHNFGLPDIWPKDTMLQSYRWKKQCFTYVCILFRNSHFDVWVCSSERGVMWRCYLLSKIGFNEIFEYYLPEFQRLLHQSLFWQGSRRSVPQPKGWRGIGTVLWKSCQNHCAWHIMIF